MTWFRVDDGFASHRKVLALKRGTERLRAIGLWTLAGSLSAEHGYGGMVPDYLLEEIGATAKDVEALIRVGLWERVENVQFHDWTVYNPDAATIAAQRVKESVSGQLGNHKRWHVTRGLTVDNCEFCHRPPDREPDSGAMGESGSVEDFREQSGDIGVSQQLTHISAPGNGQSGTAERKERREPDQDPDRVSVGVGIGSASPVTRTRTPSDAYASDDTSGAAIELAPRDDVERLCDHLADRIAEDGSKRPSIGQGWRDAARLMLDRDGRTEAEIHAAIDWCQSHHFWRANVMSMPKLREKFDQLRKVAASERQRPTNGQQHTNDLFERAAQRMGVGGTT